MSTAFEDPQLRTAAELLNSGEVLAAQRVLSELTESQTTLPGAEVLASQLLFELGRISAQELGERLEDLLQRSGPLAEAETLLQAVRAGTLRPSAAAPTGRDTLPTEPSGPPVRQMDHPAPDTSRRPTHPSDAAADTAQTEPSGPLAIESAGERRARMPTIPGDPTLPHFSSPLPPPPSPGAPRDTLLGWPSSEPAQSDTDAPPTARAALKPSSAPSHQTQIGHRPATTAPPARRRTTHPSRPPLPREEPDAPRSPRTEALSSRPFTTQRSPGPALSHPPSQAASHQSSLFAIAALVDSGEYGEALAQLKEVRASVDHELLRARAHLGLQELDQALRVLRRVAAAPLLQPETRARCARLLLDMHQVEEALEQAKRAHERDPRSPNCCYTLAWALLRAAYEQRELSLIFEAETWLDQAGSAGPLRNSVAALRAQAQAITGDARTALVVADELLARHEEHLEARVAAFLASSRLRQRERAAKEHAHLFARSRPLARVLRAFLGSLGE